MIANHLERAKRIAKSSSGWERTLPDKDDVATFRQGDYVIHLHGKRTVRLTYRWANWERELSFHGVATIVSRVDEIEDDLEEMQYP
jgi:hypothetical protein